MTSEAYLVEITERNGTRKARRHALQVPIDLARGRYERLSDLGLREAVKDLTAEQERRAHKTPHVRTETPADPRQPAAYDPMASQFKGPRND